MTRGIFQSSSMMLYDIVSAQCPQICWVSRLEPRRMTSRAAKDSQQGATSCKKAQSQNLKVCEGVICAPKEDKDRAMTSPLCRWLVPLSAHRTTTLKRDAMQNSMKRSCSPRRLRIQAWRQGGSGSGTGGSWRCTNAGTCQSRRSIVLKSSI